MGPEAIWTFRRRENHLSLSYCKAVSHLLCRWTEKAMTVSHHNWFHGSDPNSEPVEDEISV